MNYTFDSRLGEQLYRLLPEVYRTRDRYKHNTGGARNQDLARYLDAHGHLLDLIHATLEQQLKDTLPTTSQDWLLPYFAQLLAVNMVSPDSAGKHAEVDRAVSWRQRKGTIKVAEEIAEAVGRMEAEIQEGWKRVAVTPRIDMPLIEAEDVDNTLTIKKKDKKLPSRAALHPSLPAVMVDLRRHSRAVEALRTNPAAKASNFGGLQLSWRQLNTHGVPCFPGSFDDVSRRTLDVRTANETHGHFHHKRLLAYVSPPDGLIPFDAIEIAWAQRNESLYEHLIKENVENGIVVIRNQTKRVVVITDDVTLDATSYKIEGISFRGELKVAAGGKLELIGVEADRVDVATPSTEGPVVTAIDSLIGVLSAGGMVKLDGCTVRDKAFLTSVEAKDCILLDMEGSDVSGVIEYSCYPETAPFSEKDMTIEDSTTQVPAFFAHQTALNARSVLAPDTPPSIYQGAGDGGEMGYFHHRREGRMVRISGDFVGPDALHPPTHGACPLQDVIVDGDVEVSNGKFVLKRCAIASLFVGTEVSPDDDDFKTPVLEARDCLFDLISVDQGIARLEYCTVVDLALFKILQASDCIFSNMIICDSDIEPSPNCVRYSRIPPELDASTLNAYAGYGNNNTTETPVFIRLDYCTWDLRLMSVSATGELDDDGRSLVIIALVATDLYIRIFDSDGEIVVDKTESELVAGSTLSALKQRLSPLPDEAGISRQDKQEIIANATSIAGYTRTGGTHERRMAPFGEPGYGVLDRSSPDAIRFGSEDGAEMGAHHHRYHSLKVEAVLDKMREFLPVGIEPVLVQDPRLLQLPPEIENTNNGRSS